MCGGGWLHVPGPCGCTRNPHLHHNLNYEVAERLLLGADADEFIGMTAESKSPEQRAIGNQTVAGGYPWILPIVTCMQVAAGGACGYMYWKTAR